MVTRIALPHEHIHFIVSNDGKTLVNAPASEDRRDRLAAFFGGDLARDLLPVDGGDGPVRVEGFCAPPARSRASTANQFIFLNRRYVRDRALTRAIREAYEGLLMPRRYPILFLFLQVDPREVDVNVHPTKIEVRFRQARRVYVSVLSALRGTLAAADLAHPLEPLGPMPTSWEDVRRTVPPVSGRGPAPPGLPFAPAPDHLEDARTMPRRAPGAPAPELFGAHDSPEFFQVHDSYIIEETPDGFRVTDQHALHERILFEELQQRSAESAIESQRLLMPEIVQLTAGEAALAAEVGDQLRGLGIEVEEFGENTLAVQAVPRLLGDSDVGELIHDLLSDLAENEAATTLDRKRHQLLSTIACKAAIKAGQRLRPSEIQALLTRRDAVGPATETCPHGRPTSLLFDLDTMERRFKRK
jgi:DNA mismatch repair protein MutL